MRYPVYENLYNHFHDEIEYIHGAFQYFYERDTKGDVMGSADLAEIKTILEKVPSYPEFLCSAISLSNGTSKFMKAHKPNLLLFVNAVRMESQNPDSNTIWHLKEKLGVEAVAEAHYDVLMNARLCRLSNDQVGLFFTRLGFESCINAL
jgi:hypothetical protein